MVNRICSITFYTVLTIALSLYAIGAHADNKAKEMLYDVSIRKWNSFYTPSQPWWWNKAQIKAESGFNPNASSPVGAKGLSQFMPDTWTDVSKVLKINPNGVYSPLLNIQAQAYYMSTLRNQFKKPRPEWDRHSLALASYNAGLGNILSAQVKGGNSLLYSPMAKSLPLVTGKEHSKETTDYVIRIWSYIDDYDKLYKHP